MKNQRGKFNNSLIKRLNKNIVGGDKASLYLSYLHTDNGLLTYRVSEHFTEGSHELDITDIFKKASFLSKSAKYSINFILKLSMLYQRKFSRDWDTQLIKLMDKGQVIGLTGNSILTIELDKSVYKIWVENKFYSYGYLFEKDGIVINELNQFRPSIKTMVMLSNYHA